MRTMALNAGFLNSGDLRDARHAVYYAWSPYRDAWRQSMDTQRLALAAKGTRELEPGVHLGAQALVLDNIAETSQMGDYRRVAVIFDKALKEWGLLSEDTGYVDGKLISDNKEIYFDPDNARFAIRTPYCGYFSGAPETCIALSDTITAQVTNERISISLMPVGQKELSGAREYLLTAMSSTGMDETTMSPGPEVMPGFTFTVVHFAGKLYADTLEGTIRVKANAAKLQCLNPVGKVLATLEGQKTAEDVCFQMDGSIPALQFRLVIE